MGVSGKPKGISRMTKIGQGHPRIIEEIHFVGIVNFNNSYI